MRDLVFKKDNEKQCWFCHDVNYSKKRKFTVSNRKFRVCLRCIERFGGRPAVYQILEKIPFPLSELNYTSRLQNKMLEKVGVKVDG